MRRGTRAAAGTGEMIGRVDRERYLYLVLGGGRGW